MKTYARYKDSGISWIGQIPEHWDVKRVASFFAENKSINKELVYKRAYQFKYGSLVPKNEIGDEKEYEETYVKYTVLNKNDIVFNGLNLNYDFVSQRVAISPEKGIITSAYIAIVPRNGIEPMYYCWLFKTMDNKKMLHGMGSGIRLTLSYAELKSQMIPHPPVSEQKAIVVFLDEKTAKINELVAAKQKQIELLKEYKQSLIANAVTKGINPKAKMKDSGINWIGQIPEHWECSTLRKHLKFVSDKGHPEEQLLSVTREQGVIIRNTESKEENHNVIPTDLSDYKLVKKGQFAINKMKSWQGSYAVSSYTGIVSPAYYVCDLDFENKEFFSIAIRSKAYVPFFTMYSKGIRVDQWDLSPIGLKTIPFFIPPKEEQDFIVSYLKDKTDKIATQISSIEKQIENLNEYKQSLISDVVTGKVKV